MGQGGRRLDSGDNTDVAEELPEYKPRTEAAPPDYEGGVADYEARSRDAQRPIPTDGPPDYQLPAEPEPARVRSSEEVVRTTGQTD